MRAGQSEPGANSQACSSPYKPAMTGTVDAGTVGPGTWARARWDWHSGHWHRGRWRRGHWHRGGPRASSMPGRARVGE
jgi:hypothetical protein